MILNIVHLSDIHYFDKNTISNEKIADIISTINYEIKENNVDEVLIIITGDLVFSCKTKQYALFNNFIKKLKSGISIKISRIILSPGNHDIDFNNQPMHRASIVKSKNEDFKNAKNLFIGKMKNFFSFAKNFGCFVNNKELDTSILQFDGFRLKINNINSAFFSTFKDENDDNDKGLHTIDDELITLLSNDNCEMVITLMHHSPDWYDETSGYKLKECIKLNTDILLCGHEHVNDDLDYNYGKGFFTTKICGGPLCPGNESLFNCIVVDTNAKRFKTMKYQWDGETYNMIENNERKLTKHLKLRADFYDDLLRDHLLINANDFRDFYVFPELVIESDFNDEEQIISSFKDLKKELENKSICIINGTDYSGKTTLCKYLFLSYLDDKIPVLFELKVLDKKKISSILPNTFKEQYNQDLLNYNAFLKEEKDKKVAIIDDADKIDKNEFELFVDELKKTFGLIIIINGLKSEYDLLEITKSRLADSDKRIIVRIGKFYNEERKQLIQKVCSILMNNLSGSALEERVLLVNKLILNRIKLFNLYPPFIVLFVQSMVNNGFELGTKDVFNEVFSSNITNMLKDGDAEVSLMTTLLQRIAYYIHTKKEYPLKEDSLLKIISQYNEEGKGYRKSVSATEVANVLIRCRLIKKISKDNTYLFSNNSFLAYFVAKEWLRIQDSTVLTKMINNLCYGINSDILLYICFMYENAQKLFFDEILSASNKYFDEYEELNFIKENIKFVLKDNKEYNYLPPTEKEKKKASKNAREQEKEITRDSKINYIDIYDYNEEDALNDSMKIVKGIKFVEILSKILPDFIYKMEAEQIGKFVNSIYVLPNKLLYSIFKPIDDEFVKELSRDLLDNEVKRFEFDKTMREVQGVSKLIVLNIYDFVSRYSATSDTIIALENFQYYKNYNYAMQKALFYSELGDTNKFDSIIMSVYYSTENKSIRDMVKKIYYKHLLYNNINYVGKIQANISELFPSINKPNKSLHNKDGFLKFIRTRKKK